MDTFNPGLLFLLTVYLYSLEPSTSCLTLRSIMPEEKPTCTQVAAVMNNPLKTPRMTIPMGQKTAMMTSNGTNGGNLIMNQNTRKKPLIGSLFATWIGIELTPRIFTSPCVHSAHR